MVRQPKAAPPEKLARTLKRLRQFYAEGVKLNRRPGRLRWETDQCFSGGAERARKARLFAHPQTGYTPGELEELCDLCRAHGFALGSSAVILLLTVDKPRRAALQRAAVKGRWTNDRLTAEIRRRFGKRRQGGGKKVRPPRDKAEAHFRIRSLCRRWRGLCAAVQDRPPRPGQQDGVEQDAVQLDPEFLEKLRESDAVMKEVEAMFNDIVTPVPAPKPGRGRSRAAQAPKKKPA